jgi:uncharacterized protein
MPFVFPRNEQVLIGVVHLLPLPGAPRWAGSMEAVVGRAVADAEAYETRGAHAVIIENFGDVPFTKDPVPSETIAAMATAGSAVRSAIKLPIGFNVLRNDARAALALCAACGGSFIRVNVHAGAMLTDQGVIEGRAHDTLRARRTLCPDALIFADVQVKHAVRVALMPIELSARDTLHRGLADALIVSGTGTGEAVNLEELQRVRRACPDAIVLLGSGVTRDNIAQCRGLANGAIVGTSLKKDGKVENVVEAERVKELVRTLK